MMPTIPATLSTFLLALLTIFSTWLATILARRGKREDNRIALDNQSFEHMRNLAAERLVEINRLRAERDSVNAEKERMNEYWEGRVDRQNSRCRKTTDALVHAFDAMRTQSAGEAAREAAAAMQLIDEHNQDEHEQVRS
jgi:hypothetical protein